MPNLVNSAKQAFYTALNTMLAHEAVKKRNTTLDEDEVEISIDRRARLIAVKKELEDEVTSNLLILTPDQKNDLLHNYLNEAEKQRNIYDEQYQIYRIKEPKLYYQKPNTLLNLNIINDLIIFLKDKKTELKPTSLHNQSFELINNVDTESCFNVLKQHFIAKETPKKIFNSLFNNKGVIAKISWTGSLPELARFIFLLHNDYEKNGSKAVCTKLPGIYKIGSEYFSFKGNSIDAVALKNNNRDLGDTSRLKHLVKAVQHLGKPNSPSLTTSK